MSDFVALVTQPHWPVVVTVGKSARKTPSHGNFVIGSAIFVFTSGVYFNYGVNNVFI